MYSNPQKLSAKDTQDLRQEAGLWLRELRETAGLSQRELATAIGAEYYTFISQLETGRGRLPPDKYEVWAKAVGIPTRDLVKRLMRYYDPVTYAILFDDAAKVGQTVSPETENTETGGQHKPEHTPAPVLQLLNVSRRTRNKG